MNKSVPFLLRLIIIYFFLPSALILSCRWIFAFYLPLNAGVHFANFQGHAPLPPSKLALQIFNFISSLAYLFLFIIVNIIFTLPFIDKAYNLGWDVAYCIVIFLKIAIPLYAIWTVTLFTTGYLFGNNFYDEFFAEGVVPKYYFLTLEQNYKSILNLPSGLGMHISMLFDNEKKINKRISLHQKMMGDYKKDGNAAAVDFLKDAIALNEKRLEEHSGLIKAGGHWAELKHNFKKEASNFIFYPVMPMTLLYLTIVETTVAIFPALNKNFFKEEKGVEKVEKKELGENLPESVEK